MGAFAHVNIQQQVLKPEVGFPKSFIIWSLCKIFLQNPKMFALRVQQTRVYEVTDDYEFIFQKNTGKCIPKDEIHTL